MKLLSALLICFALPFAAAAKEDAAPVADVNISEFKFGKTLSGTEVTPELLKGKPVIVEFWGVNCGPCLAAMPTFNALAKRHESKGLQVIGAHSQSASDEEVLQKVKSLKIKFPVTASTQHPLKFSGIPHSAVFGSDGKLIFEGHPSDKEFDRAVKTALKSATPAKAGDSAEAPAGVSKTPEKTGVLVAERTWTNAEGKPVAAALIKVENGTGTFRRKDGTTFSYALDKLSASDQELIAAAQKE